jgi:pyruvate kinase
MSRDSRRTNIVATLGPATDDDAVLEKVILAGLDVARVNFSHGDPADLRLRVQRLREVAARVKRVVAIMGDLQGPKIRIESFIDGAIELENGASFILDTDFDPHSGDQRRVGVAYHNLTDDVAPGDGLLLDDGQIILRVDTVKGSEVICKVVSGGRLSNKKGLNKQGGGLSAAVLTGKDRADIITAVELGLDYVAVSFVRSAADIESARALVRSADGDARIVAKIETVEAVDNIDELIEASDAIMVARGDLAVEVGYAELTGLQKQIIRKTRAGNKISITATQMMESMIDHIAPTRAEVSDVANAVMDGTDAVMLSAETAVGKYPAQAVETMSQVCHGAEKHQGFRGRTNHRLEDSFADIDEAIAMATMYTANHLDVKAIIALTESGSTPLWMSRVRSDIPIYAFTRHPATQRRVCLYRGVRPVEFDIVHTDPRAVYSAVFDKMLTEGFAAEGDSVILTKGDLTGISGRTNAMKVLTVSRQLGLSDPVEPIEDD